MPDPRTIYHVALAAEWAAARATGVYEGSALCRRDGFIHMSTSAQLPATLARFFAGRRDLVLLAAETAALGSALRWDEVPGAGVFPHYYGALETARLSELGPLGLGPDGAHLLDHVVNLAEDRP